MIDLDTAAELAVAVTPASTVTHDDCDLENGDVAWRVLVNGHVVGSFTSDDDSDAEDAAVALRCKYQARIDALTERAVLTQGLRDLATFLQDNPDVPCHYASAHATEFRTSSDEFRAACEAMLPLGAVVGDDPTRIHPDAVHVERRFGPVIFQVQVSKTKVCERRTEVKSVTEMVLPAWAQPEVEPEAEAA